MTNCELCGEPLPESESMFRYHGYSGNCPKPPLSTTKKEVLVKYSLKHSRDDDTYYIETTANGHPHDKIDGFETLAECERAYKDLLSMQRNAGAIDLPNKPQ